MVFKYKVTAHANSQTSPLSQARETDRQILCLCVTPALMDQMAGKERRECLQIRPTVR